jgi:hypothetical protein
MLLEVTTCIALSTGARCVSGGDSVFFVNGAFGGGVTIKGSIEPSVCHGESVENAIANDLSFVPEVDSIFVERAEGNLLIWVTANRPSAHVRERIFDKQFAVIDAFPEVSFDFNIVSTDASSAGEISSSAKLLFTRG